MGVKLDDIIGNKNDDILVDKSKRTVNLLMVGIVVVVILIAIVAFLAINKNANARQLVEVREKISDTNAISETIKNLSPSQYIGLAQDSRDVQEPISLVINGQKVIYKYGYYYLTSSESNTLVSTLNLKNQEYIVNY